MYNKIYFYNFTILNTMKMKLQYCDIYLLISRSKIKAEIYHY